jgi:hypothetical protein
VTSFKAGSSAKMRHNLRLRRSRTLRITPEVVASRPFLRARTDVAPIQVQASDPNVDIDPRPTHPVY